MIYLSTQDLLHIAHRAVGSEVGVRDIGLLHSAAVRPQTTLASVDAYPSLESKCAALVRSILRNHALIDGNKRLALAALIAMLGVNGRRLSMSQEKLPKGAVLPGRNRRASGAGWNDQAI